MEKGDKCMRKTMQILFGSLILMFCLSVNVFAATTEYDISPNGDGSSIGVFDDVAKTLTIKKVHDSGVTKDYTQNYISGTGNAAQTPWGNISYKVTKIVVEEGITELGNNLFAQTYSMGSLLYFENVQEISLPSTLRRIGDSCFYMGNTRNPKLTSITVPAAVQTIGKNAFQYQKNVITLNFENGSKLTSIGDNAFDSMTSVKSIDLPDSVRVIGNGTFYGTKAKINLNEGLLEIGGSAFQSGSFESLTIPSTVIKIGSDILYSVTNLKVVTNLSKTNQTVEKQNQYISSNPVFYIYGANTNFLSVVQKGQPGTQTVYLDEPVLAGTLENGVKWSYDPDTKILSYDGEGEIPSYTAGSQPWYSASYRYGIGGINLGYVTGIGSGAFSGLSFGSSSPLFWGQHESLGGVLSGQTGLPIAYQGTAPTGETEDKTGIWNYVDEVEVVFPDVQPRIQGGEILSPLRFIFQDLGATVIWNQENSYAIIRKEEMGKKVEIVLKPNSSSMWVNGQEYTNEEIGLDATVVLENGRLLLPGRAIIKAWETVQFKASRPSATVYEDYYFKTSEPVAGGDDKLNNIPVIDEWQEEGTVITPDNEEEVINGGGDENEFDISTTNVIFNIAPTILNVRVPIIVDVQMLADGSIIIGDSYSIDNRCVTGPIKIYGISVNTLIEEDEYKLVDFDSDFKNIATKKVFGLRINGSSVSSSGEVVLNEDLAAVIHCGKSKPLVFEMKFANHKQAVIDKCIGSIVFTVGFDKV